MVVVGEGHRVGQEADTEARYELLADFLRSTFPGAEPSYRWSTQDQYPVDGLPYIGRLGGPTGRLYVATGFAGWGLTNGTVAALVIRDAILGRSSPWAVLFDPERSLLGHSPGALVRENANVARQLVGGKLRARPDEVGTLEPGEAAVVAVDRSKVAVYRDDAGELHAVSATCTHMGCLVEWNEAERTWDCPCHGSRFATDGTVLDGPATTALEAVELPAGAFV